MLQIKDKVKVSKTGEIHSIEDLEIIDNVMIYYLANGTSVVDSQISKVVSESSEVVELNLNFSMSQDSLYQSIEMAEKRLDHLMMGCFPQEQKISFFDKVKKKIFG